MEQPLPSTLSSSSRLAPLLDDRLLLLTVTTPECKYVCHILDRSTKSWMPFSLVPGHMGNGEADEWPLLHNHRGGRSSRWLRWTSIPVISGQHPIEFIEQVDDHVYVGSAQFRHNNHSIYRISIRTGQVHALQVVDSHALPQPDLNALHMQHRTHWINARGPCSTQELHQNYGQVTFHREQSTAMSCYAGFNRQHSASLTTHIESRLSSAFLLVYQGHVHTLDFVHRGSQLWVKEDAPPSSISSEDTLRLYYPQSASSKKELMLQLVSISDLERPCQCLADFSEIVGSTSPFQEDALVGLTAVVVLFIPLADASGNDALYVFCYSCSDTITQHLQLGWVLDVNGTSRRLDQSAVELPSSLPVASLNNSERVALVGGRDTALLVTQDACAKFHTATETWSYAPLAPSSGSFQGDTNRFIVPNKRRGLVWNVDLSVILEDNVDSNQFHKQMLQRHLSTRD